MSQHPHSFSSGLQQPSRRRVLQTGISGLALSLASPRLLAQETVAISQSVWTGAQALVPERIAKAYQAQHPDVRISVEAGNSGQAYNRIKASLQASSSPAFNFGFFNLENTARGLRDDIWQALDPALVPNLANIDPAFRLPGDIGAFAWLDLGGIVYNKEKVPNPPTSWKDLWDPKYKGRVAFFDGFWSGNGVLATARLNGGSEDDIEPALQIYEEAARNGHIHSLFTSNAQIQQLLVSGDVWIAPHFRGIVLPWIEQGAPFGYVAPAEGQIAFPEGFQLVRGGSAAQQRVSQDIINTSLTEAAIIEYAETASVVPVLSNKNASLPRSLANDPAAQPAALAAAIQPDYARIAANHQAWLNAWTRRVKANLR